MSTSGEVPIHWDQAEIYKKRQLKTENWDWWIGDDDQMPKIPRQCPKPGCRNTQPCTTHPQGWANKNPDIPDLPPNWDKLKKMVPKTGGCWWILEDGSRCGTTYKLELDHRIPRSAGGTNSLLNLGWLCQPHHRKKTSQDRKRYGSHGNNRADS